MILSDVTLTYSDGEYGTIGEVQNIEFHDTLLTLVCKHNVSLAIPMKNIRCIHIERRLPDARSDEETKYKSRVL